MGRYRIIRTWHELEHVEQEFYDNTTEDLMLIDPHLTLALNANGNLEFTIPATNRYFYDVTPMADEFMVRDEIKDETLFVGRPISCKMTNFNTLEVYCEGAMGYLNDIMIRPRVWNSTTNRQFFKDIINSYNTIKTQYIPYQRIDFNECDIPLRRIYREANYTKAYSLIQDECLSRDGGYLMMSYGKYGEKSISWYNAPPQKDDSQLVAYGENLISFEEGYDLSDRATVIIPLGAETDKNLPGDLGKKKLEGDLYAYALTGWEDFDIQRTIKYHGYIEELKEYPNAKDTTEIREALMNDPIVHLGNLDWHGTVDIKVADLHFLDNSINGFYVGQRIDLDQLTKNRLRYSVLNDVLYVKRIEYDLQSAAPEIFIGIDTSPPKTPERTPELVSNGIYIYTGIGSLTPFDTNDIEEV